MPVNAASHVKAAQTCVVSKSLTGRTKACHFKTRHERNTLQLGQMCSLFFVWLVFFLIILLLILGMFLKATKVNVTYLARQKHFSRRLWCLRAKECMAGCSGKGGV